MTRNFVTDDSTDMMNSSVAQPPVFPTPGGGLDQGDIFFIVITLVITCSFPVREACVHGNLKKSFSPFLQFLLVTH